MESNVLPNAVMTADELYRWRALSPNEQYERFAQVILDASRTRRVRPSTPEQVFARVERRLRS